MDTEIWHIHHDDQPDIHHDEYTVEELTKILGCPRELILHEIQKGDLKARVINHQTIYIERADAVDWLSRRNHLY